jgi:hypothetical protein
MKAGYTIEHKINENSRFFVCSNYNQLNEVCYYGFTSEKIVKREKNENDIGFWKIKKLKQ